jgi:ribonuclease-3
VSRPADVVELQTALGLQVDDGLLRQALTHRSYAYEHGGLPTNERLEFLGDSVLGLVVTDTLYRRHPDRPEGQLAKLRAAVVNMRALAHVGRRLRLGDYVLLGRGEEATGGRDKASILADTIEAVIGAAYLEGGMAVAEPLVHRLVDPLLDTADDLGAALDWKTSLQELTASSSIGVPVYEVTEHGPDHAKVFSATAQVAGESLGQGQGRSKKEAEQKAAAAAWGALRERLPAAAAGSSDGSADGTPAVVPSATGPEAVAGSDPH